MLALTHVATRRIPTGLGLPCWEGLRRLAHQKEAIPAGRYFRDCTKAASGPYPPRFRFAADASDASARTSRLRVSPASLRSTYSVASGDAVSPAACTARVRARAHPPARPACLRSRAPEEGAAAAARARMRCAERRAAVVVDGGG